jgi:hypothetical protein
MKLALIVAGVAFAAASVSPADAWTHSGSLTTRRGTYTASGAGGCGGGACTYTRTVTGPNGGTVTRSGSITRTGPYRYDYTRTTTGPNGNSVTRSGTVHAYPVRPYWARY